jgi:alanine dehydrogenase
MNIGVPKERKKDERRVSLKPEQVAILVQTGHHVWVEKDAGRAVGYLDIDYAESGATVASQGEVYENAELLLKVKCPLEEEYSLLKDRHVLFAYLHFDENIPPANIGRIVATGVSSIAYEWVERDGVFPLLQPMSELTGAIFARKAMSLLVEYRGVLGGKYLPNWPASSVMVIGVGHIGANAINVFLRNQYKLIVVDKHPETLKERLRPYVDFKQWADNNADVLKFDESNHIKSITQIKERLPKVDIIICAAVRRPTLPKEKCEYIIRREDLSLMKKNSIICDATACTRDFIETCIATEGLNETYIEEGIVHHNCDHMPSLVAKTATELLTNATFPYVKVLADRGFETGIRQNPDLAKGVMCFKKHLTHEYSAKKKHLEYTSIFNLL